MTLVKGCKLLKDAGINIIGLNVIGHPDSTLQDELSGIKLNRLLQVDYPIVSFLTPYPNTELYKEFVKKSLLPEDYNQHDYGLTFFKNTSVQYPNKSQMDNFQCLFAFLVSYPFLEKFIPVLLDLPLNQFYIFLRALYSGYKHKKLLTYKSNLKENLFNSVKWLYNNQLGRI